MYQVYFPILIYYPKTNVDKDLQQKIYLQWFFPRISETNASSLWFEVNLFFQKKHVVNLDFSIIINTHQRGVTRNTLRGTIIYNILPPKTGERLGCADLGSLRCGQHGSPER